MAGLGLSSSGTYSLLRFALLTVAALLLGVVIAGQAGLFAGTRPTDIGVRNGRFKPAPATPNCVSSQSVEGYSKIAPLLYPDDGAAALARLQALVARMPAAKVVVFQPGYVHAEFTSRWLGFVDDVEFYLDPSARVIHVRSASRLGRRDFDVNRRRVEALRAALAG